MNAGEAAHDELLNVAMIAPCGMNCGICIAHLRTKNQCMGCNGDDARKARHCLVCRIRNCDEPKTGAGDFCFHCARYPCARLKQLNNRYRTRYGMSMLDNFQSIQVIGLPAFLALENERWRCPRCGGVICVHREQCIHCGHPRGEKK